MPSIKIKERLKMHTLAVQHVKTSWGELLQEAPYDSRKKIAN